MVGSGAGSGEAQDGSLVCVSSNYGIIKVDVATSTYELTGVFPNTTAFGYGHDGWWYGNAGDTADGARTLVRMLIDRVPDPASPGTTVEVIEPIGLGAHRIEDVAASPDGSVLYGVGDGWLYILDRATGEQSDIAELGFSPTGLAFMDSGELVTNDGATLYEVDPASGGLTLVGEMTNIPNDLAGMPNPATAVGPAPQATRALAAPMNPFAPGSRIRFEVDRSQEVRVAIYDLAGRLVRVVSRQGVDVGPQSVEWDGRDASGLPVASGTYFIQLTGSSGIKDSRKFSLVR